MKTFCDLRQQLFLFWKMCNTIECPEHEIIKGAGTGNLFILYNVFFNTFKNIMCSSRVRRHKDSKFNAKNRLFCHTQFEVINWDLKNPIEIFTLCLKKIFKFWDLNLNNFKLEFFEDNWKQETLNASGIGWEVRINGMEIAQVTYFKQLLGKTLTVWPIEFAYGLERLSLVLQNK